MKEEKRLLGSIWSSLTVVIALGAADPRAVLIPQVKAGATLSYTDTLHYAGAHHDFGGPVLIDIKQVTPTAIAFRYTSIRGASKNLQDLSLNKADLSISPSNATIASAPFSYTRGVFGEPPRDFAAGKSWTVDVPQSMLGGRGKLTVTVVSLDQAASSCTLGLQYEATWDTQTRFGDYYVKGKVRRESRGTVTFRHGVMTEMRLHGIDHEMFPNQREGALYFDRVKKLK
jgi:hypothetical protein